MADIPMSKQLGNRDALVAFGRRLVSLRERAGYTQSSLARAVGLSQSAISQIEDGDRNPTLKTLVMLADTFGMRVGDLLDDSGRWAVQQFAAHLVPVLPEHRHILVLADDFLRLKYSPTPPSHP